MKHTHLWKKGILKEYAQYMVPISISMLQIHHQCLSTLQDHSSASPLKPLEQCVANGLFKNMLLLHLRIVFRFYHVECGGVHSKSSGSIPYFGNPSQSISKSKHLIPQWNDQELSCFGVLTHTAGNNCNIPPIWNQFSTVRYLVHQYR